MKSLLSSAMRVSLCMNQGARGDGKSWSPIPSYAISSLCCPKGYSADWALANNSNLEELRYIKSSVFNHLELHEKASGPEDRYIWCLCATVVNLGLNSACLVQEHINACPG